jgi:hypothetical protein
MRRLDPCHPARRHLHPKKVYSKEEIRASVQGIKKAAAELRELDSQIQSMIIKIEEILWDRNYDAFESGKYSYACRKGQWRFVRTSDRTPVLNLKRDERCAFLNSLVIPT